MTRLLALAALALTFSALPANAQVAPNANDASDRLMIVNGNTGRVVYDDGRNDAFCVYRRVVVGYTWDGRRLVRTVVRCR